MLRSRARALTHTVSMRRARRTCIVRCSSVRESENRCEIVLSLVLQWVRQRRVVGAPVSRSVCVCVDDEDWKDATWYANSRLQHLNVNRLIDDLTSGSTGHHSRAAERC
ncbi:uncharacterized protein LOC116849301 [Odontomachus brunneus]|uniref:uncharacterized protein LOC116849301 n=1 Tax=Odontomachus brunneus TaxID=486640 RepID=UPI0013F28F21|nr:uncharacterized protein LOC116849301 [Odontomachus brunneus]